MVKKRIYRSKKDKMIAGVCGGIAEHFDWDPVWVRLATVVLALVHGIGILLYIAAWIIMPVNPHQKIVEEKSTKKASTKAAKTSTKSAAAQEEQVVVRNRTHPAVITLMIIALVVALVAAAGFAAQSIFCINGNGNVIQETRTVTDFDKVELQGSGKLVVTQGPEYNVILETDENLLPYYETKVIGDKLEIGTKNFNCFIRSSGLTVYVTLPEVEELTLLGSGDIASTDTITAEELEARIAGSGTINLDVNVTSLETTIEGSGDATYEGIATTHEITIYGSGDIYAFDLSTEETSVEIAGSGDAQVTAYKTLDVDIAGSGDIRYRGEPTVSQSIAGSGDVVAAEIS